MDRRVKLPKKIEIGQRSRPWGCGATLYQKVEIFDIFVAAFPPPVAIEVKFCTAKRTHVPVGPAKFDMNRCNESPLRGEEPDFWPVSKNNTGSLPLRGNPAGNELPSDTDFTCINSFKRRLTRINLNIYCDHD